MEIDDDDSPKTTPIKRPKTPMPIPRREYMAEMQAYQNGRFSWFSWRVTAGNVATIVLAVGSVLISTGRTNEKIDQFTDWKRLFEVRVNALDISGTQAGQAFIRMSDLKNLEQDRRIANGESQIQELQKQSGDVRELKAKIEDLKILLQDGLGDKHR